MNDLLVGDMEESSGGGQSFLAYLPAIAWQRRWWIVVPIIVGIVAWCLCKAARYDAYGSPVF